MPRSNDLSDWVTTTKSAKTCCELAQSNGADVVAKSVLSIIGQILEKALQADNRFLYLSFAPFAVARGGTALAPVITSSATPIVSFPPALAGATLLAVGLELGNVYGRTAVLNALSDMTVAVTQTLEQAQRVIRAPGTKTKRGIFDCDKCCREKTLPQHGSRLSTTGRTP